MARLTLTAEQRNQLNEWLYGGPTDPTGIVNWLADPANADSPLRYEQEGERDLYQMLLAQDGKNVTRNSFTNKMLDALGWVATSLDEWEANGWPIDLNQQQMRVIWKFIRNL